MKRILLAVALMVGATDVAAQAPSSSDAFMRFPLALATSASANGSVAWLVRQGDTTSVMLSKGGRFAPVRLTSRSDADGQPITDVRLSPDGRFVAFQTGASFGAHVHNPAGLLEPPRLRLWLMEAQSGAQPIEVGDGTSAAFPPAGDRLLFERGGHLWSFDLKDRQETKRLIKGGGAFSDSAWASDGSLIFVQDRGGYGFLGRLSPGSDRIEWLVTGVDRLVSPTISPDGKRVAFLRFDGRRHGQAYDQTEAEPFAIDVLTLDDRRVRTLWATREQGRPFSLEDPDSGLRWTSDDQLAFYSEHDGWARLYRISARGGAAQALTPAGCEVAESEAVGRALFVIHNCRDLNTRQISLFNPETGAETPLQLADPVLARATAVGNRIAFVGGNADEPPLLRLFDPQTRKVVGRESAKDYGYTYRFAAPAPTNVRVTAADDGRVPAQLFLPGKSGKHPALVYVHGGPQRQMFAGFHYLSYYANDFAINRHLAEQGYAVLSINYRSGIGYGRAFREAPGRGWRGASEYADVAAAGRWLAARGDVDPRRIGIWGGSYGGLLTGQALARNSDLFKAGVAIHGVFDWSWPSPKAGHLNPSGFFGVGDGDRATARSASPVGAVAGWRSPLLLISGDDDMNVDVAETVDLAQRLRERGVDVDTLILAGEPHDFVRHQSWFSLSSAISRFFGEKL